MLGAHTPPLSPTPGTVGGKAIGVGIISNCPIRQMTTQWEPEAWATGCIQVAAAFVQQQCCPIKIGSFYGFAKDAHTKAVKEKTDGLLQQITDRIIFQSRGLRSIVGDFKATTEDLAQFEIWRKHWFGEIPEIANSKWSY